MNRYRLAQIIDNVGIERPAHDSRPYALRIADTILAQFAVVELPTAENYGEGDLWTTEHGTVSINNGIVSFDDTQLGRMVAAEAHELAASLLAAVKAVEGLS